MEAEASHLVFKAKGPQEDPWEQPAGERGLRGSASAVGGLEAGEKEAAAKDAKAEDLGVSCQVGEGQGLTTGSVGEGELVKGDGDPTSSCLVQ